MQSIMYDKSNIMRTKTVDLYIATFFNKNNFQNNIILFKITSLWTTLVNSLANLLYFPMRM